MVVVLDKGHGKDGNSSFDFLMYRTGGFMVVTYIRTG
jgi:hypothetical protein